MQNSEVLVEKLDVLGKEIGVEQESAEENERVAVRFDPDYVDIVTKHMTISLLLSRTASNLIDLQPEFQRRWRLWNVNRQSRLIESLLLRVPIPAIYAAEDDDERWEIVDGIQRLSTIARFIEPKLISEQQLVLSGLEYLNNFEGKSFPELTQRLRMRLREAELTIHLIRNGTPPEVKFNIFARINTGGLVLWPQELRHAITPGKARDVLEEWAKLPEFIEATDESVRPTRMVDRELVLRFIAFYFSGVGAYRKPDMDGFLIDAMKLINATEDDALANARDLFIRAMTTSRAIFGNDAFRKRFSPNEARLPINKAVFEALSVNLARLSDTNLKCLVEHSEQVREGFINLCNDRSFETAISQGTGDIKKVNLRFDAIQNMLSTVAEHA